LLIKSISVMDSLKNKLESIKFLDKTKSLMLLVSLKVMDFQVSLRDGVLDIYKKNLTEVTEKLDVSELGIQQELHGQLPELVNADISRELKLTRKFTDLEEVKEVELKTTLPPHLMLPKRILPQWVDSHTTVSLEMISSS
jgi:hypothetical protein